jgi:AcrR family transcriptional regulator
MAALAERRKELLDSMMKEAVYEGAVAVLTQHGLSGTTMDRVAAAAGMAKGSLYNHFRSKQDLLEFVHDRAIAPIREAVSEVLEMQISAADKLARIVRRWREYVVSQHAVLEFLIRDPSAKRQLREAEQTAREWGIRQIAEIVEQGIREGTFRSVDAVAVAEMFVSASIGMAEQEIATGKTRTVQEAVDTLMGVFLHGLAAGESK